MKKLISILLVLALVIMLVPAVAEEQVTLTFSSWGDANEKAILESALAAFTAETGIKVEYLYTPEDYATKMATLAASNTLPDVSAIFPSPLSWNGPTTAC